MPRLFALDKNFPQPIVSVLSDFQADATLIPLDRIDSRMSTLDDWELLLALHHHADPWGRPRHDRHQHARPRP
jgi:hypothetical protein